MHLQLLSARRMTSKPATSAAPLRSLSFLACALSRMRAYPTFPPTLSSTYMISTGRQGQKQKRKREKKERERNERSL